MSALSSRVNYCLRVPSCSSRYAVVCGKQLATWRDRFKRWNSSPDNSNNNSSPKLEKELATEVGKAATTEAETAKDINGIVDDSPLSEVVKQKDEMIANQKAELEELNV